MRRILVLVPAFAAFAGIAYAHNGMVHVMGTVTSISTDSVTVRGTDGKTQTVVLSTMTKYLREKTAGSRQDIKTGQHVVVHATKKGDALVAAEVKLDMMAGISSMPGMKDRMSGMKMPSTAKH